MMWIKVADRVPPENEQVRLYDTRYNRIELGRYIGGRWYVEDLRDGSLSETTGVTHWGWLLESELNDDGDDD